MKNQSLNRKKHLEVQRVKCYFKRFFWNKDESFGKCENPRILGNDAS